LLILKNEGNIEKTIMYRERRKQSEWGRNVRQTAMASTRFVGLIFRKT